MIICIIIAFKVRRSVGMEPLQPLSVHVPGVKAIRKLLCATGSSFFDIKGGNFTSSLPRIVLMLVSLEDDGILIFIGVL